MFFPLKFKCTIQGATTSRNTTTGQTTQSWTARSTDSPCLFLSITGNKKTTTKEEFESGMALYLAPTVVVLEGDRIVSIKNAAGTVIETGPFEVLSVKKVVNHLTGYVHHLSCKIRGTA